jgi:polyhydroxyalkanoate synthesis regulator phasin
MREDLRRMALFTSGLAEMTRHRAEDLVRSWVRSGETTREQAQAMAHDLMEWSRQNRKELTRFVKSEIEIQVAALGVATKRDVERLERRVATLERAARSAPEQAGAPSTRKTTRTARKTARKKTAAKKTTRRSASGGSG